MIRIKLLCQKIEFSVERNRYLNIDAETIVTGEIFLKDTLTSSFSLQPQLFVSSEFTAIQMHIRDDVFKARVLRQEKANCTGIILILRGIGLITCDVFEPIDIFLEVHFLVVSFSII